MKRLTVKLVLSIVLLVLLIETILLILSVNARQESLLALQSLELAFYGETSIFTAEYIDNELLQYQHNIVGLTVFVALFVAAGFYIIYYWLVGRYIQKLYNLNSSSDPLKTKNSFKRIPSDEMGLLIQSRFNMLDKIEAEMRSNRQLLRILSHDLKNLQMVVAGNTELLLVDLDNRKFDKAETLAKSIHTAALKQTELIEAVLTLESARKSHVKYKLEEYSLVDIVEEALNIFESRAHAKNLKIIYERDSGDQFLVKTDRVLFLNNVLCNLISNAIKFSFSGDTINVSSRRDRSGSVEIIVKDHGIGIPEHLLTTLFSRKGIGSRVGTSNEAGTGFGMLILFEVANALGLTVEISSRSIEEYPESHGSEFRIRFAPDCNNTA